MNSEVCSQKKTFILKAKSWDAIVQVLSWSFGVLATGAMAAMDLIGRPRTGQRLKWSGKQFPRGVLAEVRGGWAFYPSIFAYLSMTKVLEFAGIAMRHQLPSGTSQLTQHGARIPCPTMP